MRYMVYHSVFDSFFTGNGWAIKGNAVAFLGVRYYDTPKDAQDMADAMNMAAIGFNQDKAKLPESQVCYVVDENGNRHSPPSFTKDRHVALRKRGKE